MPNTSLKQIHKRLEKNGFKSQVVEPNQSDSQRKIIFRVPAGKKEYYCKLYEDEINEEIINSEIEKYNFIVGYQAIWSKSNKTIECEIAIPGIKNATQFDNIMKLILFVISKYTPNFTPSNWEEIENIKFGNIKNLNVSIGRECSQEFAILIGCRWIDFSDGIEKNRWTLKLTNIKVNTHDEAYRILLEIANSLFFRIDMLTGNSITLAQENENRLSRRQIISMNTSSAKDPTKLLTIKRKYDDEPMAYYWYAKHAINMPLLRYLAYYQVIEFYFPVYAKRKAKEKIKEIDVLKKIIKDCVSGRGLKKFIVSEVEREKFYDRNSGEISEKNISLNNLDLQILKDEVASRIYDIRCQIAHSKKYEDKLEPFSHDIENLVYDLELIQFIAIHVLKVNSKPSNFI